MGFDDFFEDKRNHQGYRKTEFHNDHEEHDRNRYSHEQHDPTHRNEGHLKWLTVLNRIRKNKNMKLIVIMLVVAHIIMAFFLFAALQPLIIKLLNSISQAGK